MSDPVKASAPVMDARSENCTDCDDGLVDTSGFGDLDVCDTCGGSGRVPSPAAGEQQPADAKPYAWTRRGFITDSDGTPIGQDEPEFYWGAEPPEEFVGWAPLFFDAPLSAPAVQPLSEEQIDAIANSLWPDPAHGWNEQIGRPFARAIESSHGITKEPK